VAKVRPVVEHFYINLLCGLFLPKFNTFFATSDAPYNILQPIRKCDERVIQLLVREKRRSINLSAMQALLERGSTYDTLKICWQSYRSDTSERGALMPEFFQKLENKKFADAGYKVRPLILMAWNFDKNCLFRQVPKEIMMEILSYDGIDEPPYWDFLDFVIKDRTKTYRNQSDQQRLEMRGWGSADLLKVIPLIWKNWELPSYSAVKKELMTALYDRDYQKVELNVRNTLLKWTLKFLQRMPDPPNIVYGSSNLSRYCLLTPNDITLSIFKLLNEKKVLKLYNLRQTEYFQWGSTQLHQPLPYLAILGENLPIIEILIDNNIMFQTAAELTEIRKFLLDYPEKQHVITFIRNYMRNVIKDRDQAQQ
jgi:hypothetical protein